MHFNRKSYAVLGQKRVLRLPILLRYTPLVFKNVAVFIRPRTGHPVWHLASWGIAWTSGKTIYRCLRHDSVLVKLLCKQNSIYKDFMMLTCNRFIRVQWVAMNGDGANDEPARCYCIYQLLASNFISNQSCWPTVLIEVRRSGISASTKLYRLDSGSGNQIQSFFKRLVVEESCKNTNLHRLSSVTGLVDPRNVTSLYDWIVENPADNA